MGDIDKKELGELLAALSVDMDRAAKAFKRLQSDDTGAGFKHLWKLHTSMGRSLRDYATKLGVVPEGPGAARVGDDDEV